jgi:multidrug resistance efflux pump
MAIDSNKYIEVLIEEEEVDNIFIGQEVDMTLDAAPDDSFVGEVYYV